MPGSPPTPLKPRLRGVLHQWACACSLPLGLALLIVAGTARARIALSVYALSLIGLFGASALYHRIVLVSIANATPLGATTTESTSPPPGHKTE